MDKPLRHASHIQKQIESLKAEIPYGANLKVEFVGGQFYIWRTRQQVDDITREIPILRGRYAVVKAFIDGVKFGVTWSRSHDTRRKIGVGSVLEAGGRASEDRAVDRVSSMS